MYWLSSKTLAHINIISLEEANVIKINPAVSYAAEQCQDRDMVDQIILCNTTALLKQLLFLWWIYVWWTLENSLNMCITNKAREVAIAAEMQTYCINVKNSMDKHFFFFCMYVELLRLHYFSYRNHSTIKMFMFLPVMFELIQINMHNI